ncbi:MAG: hypothetical protein ACXWAX_09265, partial [Chthoniobacterales bacterium]
MKHGGWKTAGCILLALALAWETTAPSSRAAESFTHAIKRVFNPTPTPTPKRHRHSTKNSSPTPAPSASPKTQASPSPIARRTLPAVAATATP